MTDFDALLTTLWQHEVAFIVVGGAAAIAHGSARLTQDLDIPFIWDTATLARGLNFTLVTSLGEIDLLGEIPGGGTYEELVAEAVERRWRSWKRSKKKVGERRAIVATLPDLLAPYRHIQLSRRRQV
jgi:hypothetical protein